MRYFVIFSLLALALALPGPIQAEPQQATTKQFKTLSAKVTKIDKATHTLTLLNDRNESRTITVNPDNVKNFDQIKVGDNVVVREKRSLTLALDKGMAKKDRPTEGGAMTAATAPQGAKPGMAAKDTETVRGEIVKIDKPNMMVTLKGPDGNLLNVKGKDAKAFDSLKIGDKVWATYTTAFAITVEPPK
ncbi:MAG: hypothetical protein R3257_07175 [bacterium]|nr:hypothetical protein [bacterium]